MALSRKFGSRTYYFDCIRKNSIQASARAEAIRQSGGMARVISDPDGWVMWSRSK